MDSWQTSLVSLRTLHIVAGIVWIGALYFLNFSRDPKAAPIAGAPALSGRVLGLFRWSAMTTFVAGIAWMVVYDSRSSSFLPYVSLSNERFKAILIGGGLGTVMVLNTWAIIWPTQKRILASMSDASPDSDLTARARRIRRINLTSRVNIVLSFPMLTFMVLAGHVGGV